MARCDTCGNDYERTLEVTFDGRTYTFDCFECAIHRLAPKCKACSVRIIGHGVQADEELYCSSHCAKQQGVRGVETHVAHAGGG